MMKGVAMNLERQIRFRVTSKELTRLDELAAMAQRTRSDLLRRLIERAEVVPMDTRPVLISEEGEREERERQ